VLGLSSFEEAVLGFLVFVGRSAAGVSSFVESSAFNTVAEFLSRLGVGSESLGTFGVEEELSELGVVGRSTAGVGGFVESSAFNTVAEFLSRLGVGSESLGTFVLEEEVSEFGFLVVVGRSTAGVVISFVESGTFNSVAEFLSRLGVSSESLGARAVAQFEEATSFLSAANSNPFSFSLIAGFGILELIVLFHIRRALRSFEEASSGFNAANSSIEYSFVLFAGSGLLEFVV